MRMDKGAILASMAIIALASVLVGAGTMAYFSATETVTTTIESGTVDLRLSLNGIDWGDSLTVEQLSLNPCDTFTIIVWMKNIGSCGMKMLKVGAQKVSGSDALADKIEITTLDATEFGQNDYMGCPMPYWDSVLGDNSGTFTLKEYAESPYSACFWEGSHPPTTDYLEAGGTDIKKFKIVFHFDEEAGNEYQGLTYIFKLKITVTDDTTILGSG